MLCPVYSVGLIVMHLCDGRRSWRGVNGKVYYYYYYFYFFFKIDLETILPITD